MQQRRSEQLPARRPAGVDYTDAMNACLRALLVLAAPLAFAAEQPKNYPPTLGGGAPCGSCDAPAQLSWKTVIPPENEPGEPLVITGHVFQPDGKTPAEGMVLWVYHTDPDRLYSDKDDASHPRLKGWMKISADGEYEFERSVRRVSAPLHARTFMPCLWPGILGTLNRRLLVQRRSADQRGGAEESHW